MTRSKTIDDDDIALCGVRDKSNIQGGTHTLAKYTTSPHDSLACSTACTIGTYNWILETHIPLRNIQARFNQELNGISSLLPSDESGFHSMTEGKNAGQILVEEMVLAEVARSRCEDLISKGESGCTDVQHLLMDCIAQHELVVSSIIEQLVFDCDRVTLLEYHVLELAEYVQRKVCLNRMN